MGRWSQRLTVAVALALLPAAVPAGARAARPAQFPPAASSPVTGLEPYVEQEAARPLTRVSRPSLPRVAEPGASTRTVVRLRVGGLARAYVVVSPQRPNLRLPLIVALPGVRQTALQAEQFQGWDSYAARGQAIVVYGSSYGGAWAAGTCCVVDRPGSARPVLDDVAYLDRVLAQVQRTRPVDRRRVFLVGFSNGGMMAYRYACARPGVLAAMAVVASTSATPGCHPSRALPVLALHGARDDIIPLAGARFSAGLHAPLLAPTRALDPWRAVARGTGVPVQLRVLPRMAHLWPTVSATGVDGTSLLWRFLSPHVNQRTLGLVARRPVGSHPWRLAAV